MIAYHFLRENMRSGAGDEPPWTIGERREIAGPVELCRRGYHACWEWLDCLKYASGPIACIVEVDGTRHDDTKCVSSWRKLIAVRNASQTLIDWARDCRTYLAEQSRWETPDPALYTLDAWIGLLEQFQETRSMHREFFYRALRIYEEVVWYVSYRGNSALGPTSEERHLRVTAHLTTRLNKRMADLFGDEYREGGNDA